MEKYFKTVARDNIRIVKIFSWFLIIYGIINLIFLIKYGNNDKYLDFLMPLWKRIYIISSSIIGGIMLIREVNKLSAIIPNLRFEVFELKFAKVISYFFVFMGISLFIMSIGDEHIIKWKAYLFSIIIILIGIGWFYLSKYWLRKELLK